MAEQTTQIGVKQAVQIARDYLLDVYDGQALPNLLLEETQISEDEQYWHITFSFDTGHQETIYRLNIPITRPERAYKVVTIQASNGKVESLTNRVF